MEGRGAVNRGMTNVQGSEGKDRLQSGTIFGVMRSMRAQKVH